MRSLNIITTADGSHSLFDEQLNETFHSVHGAIQESVHVFIRHGLDYATERLGLTVLSLLEVGFGTGLNALLTASRSTDLKQRISYTTIEAYPLEESIWSRLNYADGAGSGAAFMDIHQARWGIWERIHPYFDLLKLHTRLESSSLPQGTFDLVYFDAFAPAKQPDLWTLEQLHRVVDAMSPRGIFVTYCAKGQLKRDLRSLGLDVATLAGPPGKKEMVRAEKKGLI